MVDTQAWEGGFSITSQTSLGKGIFINATDKIDISLRKNHLDWDDIFWLLTYWSGKGNFLLPLRLVWGKGFSLMPHTRLMFYCENNILSRMIFFGVCQTCLGGEIFSYYY